MCRLDCLQSGQGNFGEGPWRWCSLCDRAGGCWYHLACLGQPIAIDWTHPSSQLRPVDGGVPVWIRGNHVEDVHEVVWNRVLSMPIQRGYPQLGDCGTFLSFERVLTDVRAMEVPANVHHTLATLVTQHVWSPREWWEDSRETLRRSAEALNLFLELVAGEQTYCRCPNGHVC